MKVAHIYVGGMQPVANFGFDQSAFRLARFNLFEDLMLQQSLPLMISLLVLRFRVAELVRCEALVESVK